MKMADEDLEINNINICAGMHFVKGFGETWKELLKDNLKINGKVKFLNNIDKPEEFSKQLGIGVNKFTKVLVKFKPDIICVCGDRIENLSLFVSATTLKFLLLIYVEVMRQKVL